MQHPEIVIARTDNGAFDDLKRQWEAQCENYGYLSGEYAPPYMKHAEEVVAKRSGSDYGIACLRSRPEGGYIALFHANRARLPRTTGVTLRVLWVLPSPKFDEEDIRPSEMAELAAGVVFGAMELASGAMRSDHVKIHLSNVADRNFVLAMAHSLPFTTSNISVETRGNWLHISGFLDKE